MLPTDYRDAIPGSLVFGVGIYGVPSIDTYVVIWEDVCPGSDTWDAVSGGNDGFSSVDKPDIIWNKVEPDPTETVRCKDAT